MSGNGNKKGSYFIVLVLVIVLGVWFSYPFWSYLYKDYFYNTELSDMGVFGDSYGALNTLFSALAFTGIIASIYFQREELKATREELEATRNEMKNQGEQFSEQTKAMQKQVFESSFFNMMSLHNANLLELKQSNILYNASDTLNRVAAHHQVDSSLIGDCKSYLKAIYDSFIDKEYDKIGHYFRYLYQILKFVDNSKLSLDERITYSNILRAQMSNHELVLLFVNCQCYERSNKFKVLVENYSFFEHIYEKDINVLLLNMNNNLSNLSGNSLTPYTIDDLKSLYAPLAYGR